MWFVNVTSSTSHSFHFNFRIRISSAISIIFCEFSNLSYVSSEKKCLLVSKSSTFCQLYVCSLIFLYLCLFLSSFPKIWPSIAYDMMKQELGIAVFTKIVNNICLNGSKFIPLKWKMKHFTGVSKIGERVQNGEWEEKVCDASGACNEERDGIQGKVTSGWQWQEMFVLSPLALAKTPSFQLPRLQIKLSAHYYFLHSSWLLENGLSVY